MSRILTKAKDLYVNLRGFHTKRKLVVIESDDWGSIRMPSKETFDALKEQGDTPENDAFLSNDCLESEEDLNNLFEVLSSVKDSKGNTAKITANFAMANPNFEKIDFQHDIYEYEPFYETYARYYGENNSILSTIKTATEQGVFMPQLHCREHLNVDRWLTDLKSGKDDTLKAFNNRMIGIGKSFDLDNPFGYMDAFNSNYSSNETLSNIFNDASKLFENTFKFNSETFVASCFVWSQNLEKAFSSHKIKGIQSASWQNVPFSDNEKLSLKRKLHYTGEKNKFGQVYIVRNCSYEPAYHQNPEECVEKCFDEIKKSFACKKPAIINSHRFNYISSINPENAKNNLLGLKKLLNKIIDSYPDVEFIFTPELVNIMLQEKK